jgi:hypothetical protein
VRDVDDHLIVVPRSQRFSAESISRRLRR